ncbi:hypothetical protein SAMN05421741_1197 [Paenimyroides ummariense]|uniref:Uncharacterized protein n=1 Tax=Paenimyroides ummariense TaxID=913024 RepID=A0A1I5E6N3_9FLAO|nr:hypothetical protein [Paenimyroides ummariense]SFO07026.1 hypothetical protein SAMN05421741_1197 [Paenimyroides ummariense]
MATNYFSPWDIWYNRNGFEGLQPSYGISNGDEDENYSPYRLEVYAWVGLAYFDGDNDGIFNDYSLPAANQIVANMATNPAQYQNLLTFNAGQPQEVGNLVKTINPLVFQPQQSARIEDLQDHLPMPGGTLPRYPSFTPPWAFGQWADGFDFAGTLQPQEELLLRDYGKVFFYEVEVFEAATNAFVGTYILHPEIKTLSGGLVNKWHPVENTPGGGIQLQGNLPFGSFNLHYYTDGSFNPTTYSNFGSGSGQCNSFELVFEAPSIKHQHTITGSVPKTLTMDIWQDVPTFWQRSALHLRVH